MQCTRWNTVHSPPSIWSPIWSWSYYELLSSLDLFVLEFLSLSSNEIIPFNLKSSTIPEFDQLEPLIPGWRDGKKSCWGKGKWNQGAKGKISESQSRLKFVCPILPADYLKTFSLEFNTVVIITPRSISEMVQRSTTWTKSQEQEKASKRLRRERVFMHAGGELVGVAGATLLLSLMPLLISWILVLVWFVKSTGVYACFGWKFAPRSNGPRDGSDGLAPPWWSWWSCSPCSSTCWRSSWRAARWPWRGGYGWSLPYVWIRN